jgi:hypothetical protein
VLYRSDHHAEITETVKTKDHVSVVRISHEANAERKESDTNRQTRQQMAPHSTADSQSCQTLAA